MTKVKVTLDVSQRRGSMTFDLEYMNLTKEKWDKMSDPEKTRHIQAVLDEQSDQPFWVVNEFTEI